MNHRSPSLMNADDSALIIIDVQERLVTHIENHERLVWNVARLIEGAKVLGIGVEATEQYPKGLGGTVESLRQQLVDAGCESVPAKTMFSCRECATTFNNLADRGIRNLLLTGIETHVCVAQSAIDLIAAGFSVTFAPTRSVQGIRLIIRPHSVGWKTLVATLTTTEAALFEWCERAGSDEFKKISKLIQQSSP